MSYWPGPILDKSVDQYRKDGLVYYRVTNKYCTGTVYLQGAHVTEWAPILHKPVLWMSECSDFKPGKPFRGGIPICFPYFGNGVNEDKELLHGPVRIAEWTLVQTNKTQSGYTQLVFTYEEPTGQYALRYTVVLGLVLTTKLQITNTSTKAFHCEGIFHSYLAVGQTTQTSVLGLQGEPYVDRVTDKSITNDPRPIGFGEEVNRLYTSRNQAVINDHEQNRTIYIFSEGTGSVCIWNPGPSKTFADITPNGWREFVCVERGSVRNNALVINPNGTACLTQTITVE